MDWKIESNQKCNSKQRKQKNQSIEQKDTISSEDFTNKSQQGNLVFSAHFLF